MRGTYADGGSTIFKGEKVELKCPTPQGRDVMAYADHLESLVDFMGRAVSWVVLLHVALVAVNVILRYLFQIGPVSLQEMEWHLMSPIALIGMSYALRHDDHVRVDIVYDKYSPVMKAWVDAAAAIATIAISVVMIRLSLDFVLQSWTEGEISPDPGGLSHRWILKSFIPLGFFLLAVQGAAIAVRRWTVIRGIK